MTLASLRDPGVWCLTWFLIALAACVIAPYVLGVRPRTRRDWTLIALTIAFAAWLLLPQMFPVG